jgi:hypothetical protein
MMNGAGVGINGGGSKFCGLRIRYESWEVVFGAYIALLVVHNQCHNVNYAG